MDRWRECDEPSRGHDDAPEGQESTTWLKPEMPPAMKWSVEGARCRVASCCSSRRITEFSIAKSIALIGAFATMGDTIPCTNTQPTVSDTERGADQGSGAERGAGSGEHTGQRLRRRPHLEEAPGPFFACDLDRAVDGPAIKPAGERRGLRLEADLDPAGRAEGRGQVITKATEQRLLRPLRGLRRTYRTAGPPRCLRRPRRSPR